MKLLVVWLAGCLLWLADVVHRQDDAIATLRTRVSRLERQPTAGNAWRTSPPIPVHAFRAIARAETQTILRDLSRKIASDTRIERPGGPIS